MSKVKIIKLEGSILKKVFEYYFNMKYSFFQKVFEYSKKSQQKITSFTLNILKMFKMLKCAQCLQKDIGRKCIFIFNLFSDKKMYAKLNRL